MLDNSIGMFYSKRTTNRILNTLASCHDDTALERKRRAEIVLAAPTSKKAAALARSGDSGGQSFFSDNVGKVMINRTKFFKCFGCNSGKPPPTPQSIQGGGNLSPVHTDTGC